MGYSRGVNLGIGDGHENGIITSATLMANMPAAQDALALHTRNPRLGIGVHLNLTAGRPVLSGHKTIVDEAGGFFKQGYFFDNIEGFDINEIRAELDAQILHALNLGFEPTHLDGHHHIHAHPVVKPIFISLCKKYSLAARSLNDEFRAELRSHGIKTADAFSSAFFGEYVSESALRELIGGHEGGVLEIMTHPAYIDYELYNGTSYCVKRIDELHALTADGIKGFVRDKGIELVSYGDI